MAKLTLTSFLTLDGVMQAPGGPNEDPSGNFQHGGWVVPYFDPDLGAIMFDIFSRASAFLLGRGTYDIFSAHWQKVTDPGNLVATKLNSLPKFVASRTQTNFDWNNTKHVAEVTEDLESIKSQFEGELQVHGSCGLAQTLIEHNLIDEYRLFIFPVALGTGKRLFNSFSAPAGLELMGARSMRTGVTYNVYRPTQEFQTGSFELE
ncbi:MAG: dihydrofolate reductase family protein [Gammaproteobacteria bacterium]|nr:dihydrofolate reductase family protein [Gammaproteobacteria bacterium]